MLISAKKVNSVSNNLQVINNPRDIELKFNVRPHPFKVFEESLLPKLLSLEMRYNECLMEAKNDAPLALYLFKNNYLSCSSRITSKSCFLKFI